MTEETERGPGRPRDPAVDEAIHQAAIEVLSERGWVRSSIEEIAERAGVSKASIYRRYPSKAALALAAVAADRQAKFPSVDTGSVWGELTAFALGAERMSRTPCRKILCGLIAEGPVDPEVAAMLRQAWQFRRDLIHGIVGRGVARHELRANTDPETLLELIDGPLMLRVLITGLPVDPAFADRLVEDATRFFGTSYR